VADALGAPWAIGLTGALGAIGLGLLSLFHTEAAQPAP
jgi:hypothetical protein